MHNAPTGCKTILLAVDPLKGEVAEWHQRVGAGMRCSFGSLPTQTILRFHDPVWSLRAGVWPMGWLWEVQCFGIIIRMQCQTGEIKHAKM